MLIENRPNGPVGVNFSRQTLATGVTCISGFRDKDAEEDREATEAPRGVISFVCDAHLPQGVSNASVTSDRVKTANACGCEASVEETGDEGPIDPQLDVRTDAPQVAGFQYRGGTG